MPPVATFFGRGQPAKAAAFMEASLKPAPPGYKRRQFPTSVQHAHAYRFTRGQTRLREAELNNTDLTMQHRTTRPILIGAALALIGCQPPPAHQAIEAVFDQPEPAARDATPSSTSPDPCSFALAPHSGESRVDREIIRLQQEIQRASNPAAMLERLGWMFVAKARASFDPGFYTLAEQCALCLESKQPDSAESLLLRGHVLHNLHRFRAAEPLARRLVAQRGLAVDFGLLGDLLMEQGRLAEAVEAYQAMIDRKPDPQAYARVAHVRWLKGDLAGATEMMQMAAGAAGPSSPETAAWFQTRLAFYRFQGGAMTEAGQA